MSERGGLKQPERYVDRSSGYSMRVLVDLPGVHRKSQPDPRLLVVGLVMLA